MAQVCKIRSISSFKPLLRTTNLNFMRGKGHDNESYRYSSSLTDHKDDLDIGLTSNVIKDESLINLVPRSLRAHDMPHQVYILQPYIKWGKRKNAVTTPTLQLEEGAALIRTLPNWTVVGSKIISSVSFEKNTYFNSGQLEMIYESLKNEFVSALFINSKSLKVRQLMFLEKYLNVPIFDRYSIIINIFKFHACSKEAKLQVALAEIPYMFSRICGVHENDGTLVSKNVGIGSVNSLVDKRLNSLKDHKRKLSLALIEVRKKRDLLRNKRRKLQFPVVAVVGYTNAGKTSLIKCLTEDASLRPEDRLFATLDVTAHAAQLHYNIKVILMDTIGFISDIPTSLLEPFVATLEDALLADVIVHVKDVSHPDHAAQELEVLETLKKLKLPDNIISNVITVGNKCDKKQLLHSGENIHLISCRNLYGVEDLKRKIAEAVIKAKEMMKIQIRVSNGGEEYQWLLKECAVSDIVVDEDPQYLILHVFISKSVLNKFKHEFIS